METGPAFSPEATAAADAADPDVRAWEALMDQFQKPLPDAGSGGKWRSAELIFDQGLGDIFSIRVAGNVMSDDIVGSLEYATAIAGSKLILVLGHTGCGAIKGACDNVQFGNLTGLLAKIHPSVDQEKTHTADRNSNNAPFVNAVAEINVKNTVKDILRTSPVIRELVEKGEIGIASAMYDVSTGKVSIHEDEAIIFYKDKAAVNN